MGNHRVRMRSSFVLFWALLVLRASSSPVSIPLGSVSDLLIQSALDSLNENSPTHHTYKSGNLISAQKLLEPPYVIYRLTLNLEPNCNSETSTCSREACAIDLRQHELGVIDVQKNSIQCMYIYAQTPQDDVQQHTQEMVQDGTIMQDQEIVESKRVTNESVQLDHEVQAVTDNIDRPFVAVRAPDRNYCPGCPYELNPTLAGLAAFGEQVVQSMDDSGRSDFKHKVVSIVRVTRAVPPGLNVVQYELLLEIGETNCLRTGLSRRTECSLLTNVPIKLCLVTFEERPWRQNSRRMTRNNCTDVPAAENELDGRVESRTASESLAASASLDVQTTPEATPRLEIYDQVAEEGKLGSYGSAIDEFFANKGSTAATVNGDDETRLPVTEESLTKVVLSTENVKPKGVGFTDKIKEFDEFLEDFDVEIKPRAPQPVDQRTPVTEEIIRPEVVMRPSAERNAAVGFTGDVRQSEQSTRSKRSIADTSEDEKVLVHKLAQKALNTLDDIDLDNKKRVVLDVVDSKKLDGDGTIFYITMIVAPTECDEADKNVHGCLDKTREPVKICKVHIRTNDETPLESAKVFQSRCYDEPLRTRVTRVRRSHRLGGRTPKNVDDPEIINYAEQGLRKYSEISKSSNEPYLLEILEASAQVVSGMLYKIKVRLGESTCPKGKKIDCQLKSDSETNDYLITVWSQPWIDHGNPDIKIELDTDNEVPKVRKTRQIPGGGAQKPVDDPEIVAYAHKGLRKYSETSVSTREPHLVDILEATEQVVSGKLYKIKVRVGESTCLKGTTENCALLASEPTKDYLITVWSQPWIDHGNPDIKIELDTANEVPKVRKTRQIPGGVAPKLVDDPEIVAYAHKGLRKYSETSVSTREPHLIEILEATEQVVSGTLYKIKVRVGESTCLKGATENCALLASEPTKDYLITVWSQPWIDHGNPDIKIELDTANEVPKVRKTRQIAGGVAPKLVDNPEIIAYAHKGLRKYSETSVSTHEPHLIEILEATEQVVSGKLYNIKVRMGESTCLKGTTENCALLASEPTKDYLITVWSQPWIDHGNPDIKVEELATKNGRSRRAAVHIDWRKISTDDPQIKGYGERALQQYSQSSEATYEPLLAEIAEALVQTVSGKLYKIKVKFAESTCPKGTKENCQLRENGENIDCLATVWSQPWKDNGNPEIKLQCDEKLREKRSLRGANYSAKMLKLRKNIEHEIAFNKFMEKYGVVYESETEKTARFRVFKDNMKNIEELRSGEKGTAEYGVTMFADLTPDEFRAKYTGYKPHMRRENDIPLPQAEIPDIELPEEFDWRHYNVVTEVKNQGACGSCWAFAVTGNMESLYALKHGELLSLSEQELVDCDTFDEGCSGGLVDTAYRAIESLGGLETESDYPYEAKNEKCHFDKSKARVRISSGLNITTNETQMAQWLVKNGPISIGINANAMQFYVGGISHPFKFLCRSGDDDIDHGVLIVGFGVHTYPVFKKTIPFWIIKNSWGPRWGEQGYYRVYRGDGTCGVNKWPSSAVVV